MAQGYNIARNDHSRAFIFRSGVNVCCPNPHYFPCMGIDSLSQDFGDITKIECPDPYNYGKFIEVAGIPGEVGRMTTTLTTRLSRTELSLFRSMAVKGCPFDLHLHFGLCQRPTDFNAYDKVLIFKDVYVTSYGTDPLVALTSADRDSIMETVDISIGDYYEIVLLDYLERASVLTDTLQPIIDSTWTDTPNCGLDCPESSDGCSYGVAIDENGIVIRTSDGGVTWTQQTADWDAGDNHVGISWLAGYAWSAQNNATNTFAFASKDDIWDDVAPTAEPSGAATGTVFTDQETGQSIGIVVGSAGFIGTLLDPCKGFEDMYVGTITTETLNKVQFKPGTDTALVVGENGTVIYFDGQDFKTVTTTGTAIAGLSLTAALPLSSTKWLVGDSLGNIYCTADCGNTWEEMKCASTKSPVHDIQQGDTGGHVIYASIGTDLLKSIDGGCNWAVPTKDSCIKSISSTTVEILDILPCPYDPNYYVFVGQDGATGVTLTGAPADRIG